MKNAVWLLSLILLAGCQGTPVKNTVSQHESEPVHSSTVEIPIVIRNEPPKIIVRENPAHLLEMDGPILFWARIKRVKEWIQPLHNMLEFALNTNEDLFLHKPSKRMYLRIGGAWWTMPTDAKHGRMWPEGVLRWQPVNTLPEGFELLPTNDEEWLPAYEASRNPKTNPELEIITVFEPAELVQLDGPPRLEPIPGTDLAWVANADKPLIRQQDSYYLLLSGRWFAAPSLADDARWVYATPNLPEDFTRLPKQAPWQALRASVPGTPEAEARVRQWGEPHAHAVALEHEPSPVTWIEQPQFVPVEGTDLLRGRNTRKEIVQTPDHRYWRCEKRAWYVAVDPQGPWKPATEIPASLRNIPAESPLFHCRFLWPEKVEDGQVIFHHTMGYGHHYLTDGVVVEGSGHPYATDFLFVPFWQEYNVPIQFPQTYGAGKEKPLGIWYLPKQHNYVHSQEKKPTWHELLH